MYRRASLACLVMFLPAISSVFAAQRPEVTVTLTLDDVIAVQVRGLGAKKHVDREAASAALKRIGAAARPALLKAAESDDPEVRLRARALLATLPGQGRGAAWPDASRKARAEYERSTPEERLELIRAIAQMDGGAENVPFLLSLLRGPEQEVLAVLATLSRVPGVAAGQMALKFLNSPQSIAEWRARAWALARVGARLESYRLLAEMKVAIAPALKADAAVASGRRLLRDGQHKKALAEFGKAREAFPTDTRFLYLEAEALAAVGKLDEATKLRARALAMLPKEDAAYAVAGRMLSQMGRRRMAVAEWRALLAMAPKESAWGVFARMHLIADLEEGGAFKEASDLLIESLALLISMRDAGHAMGILGVEIPSVEAHVMELQALGEKFPLPADGIADALPAGEAKTEISMVVKDGKLDAYKRALADAAIVLRIAGMSATLRPMDIPGVGLDYDVAAGKLTLGITGMPCSKPVAWDAGGKPATVAVVDRDHCHVFSVDGATGAIRKLARYDVDSKVRIVPGKLLAACADHTARLNGLPMKWDELLAGKTFDTPPTVLRLTVTATTPAGPRATSSFDLALKKP